jgi:hypothetical protein
MSVILQTAAMADPNGAASTLLQFSVAEHLFCSSNMSMLTVKSDGYQPISINAITRFEAVCGL